MRLSPTCGNGRTRSGPRTADRDRPTVLHVHTIRYGNGEAEAHQENPPWWCTNEHLPAHICCICVISKRWPWRAVNTCPNCEHSTAIGMPTPTHSSPSLQSSLDDIIYPRDNRAPHVRPASQSRKLEFRADMLPPIGIGMCDSCYV